MSRDGIWDQRSDGVATPRQVAHSVLLAAALYPGARLKVTDPDAAFAGLQQILKTAAKRHRRYWGRRADA